MKTVYQLTVVALVCCAGSALAADLNLAVTDGAGSSSITVLPGDTINIKITGLLSSSADNEGLALFGVDLSSASGPAAINMGTAATISAPSPSMDNFVSPNGLNNPTGCTGCFGFGGTAIGDVLVQIGGGMNTIGNTVGNAPFPIGTVDLAIAHISIDLATGTLTMPLTEGVYTIDLSNGFANVITLGQTTAPVYATEAVPTVSTSSLTVTVTGAPCVATAVRSCADHDCGRLCLDLLANAVEPRAVGTTELEIDFATGTAPTSPSVASISCDDGTTVSAPASVGSASVLGDTVTVSFSPALPDENACVVELACGASVCIRMLQGDINQSGGVTTGDFGAVRFEFNKTACAAGTPAADFSTIDGVTTGDASAVRFFFNNTVPACP